MSQNFRDNVQFHIIGIEGQSNKRMVPQKKISLKFRDNFHFDITGTESQTIKKPDWFSKKKCHWTFAKMFTFILLE